MNCKLESIKIIGISILAVLLVFAAQTSAQYGGYKLTVEAQGDGYVDSYPSGILCGAACVETYSAGTLMTLRAHPNEGATFTKWGGCDEISGTTCTLSLNSDRTVVATFSGEVKSEYNVRVYRTGSPGVVQSDPFAIYCGSICVYDEAKFDAGSTVKLIASSNPGYAFTGWSGDCEGTSPTCTLTVDSAKIVTATFGVAADDGTTVPSSTYLLTTKKSGEGTGAITSSDRKIKCGTACTSNYNKQDSVTLTATADPGSTFSGWSGACSGTKNTCTLTFDSANTVIAEFSKTTYTYGLKIATSTTPKGGGKIVSADGKVDCATCSVQYPEGTSITLNAVPSSKSVIFGSWGGADCEKVNTPSCTITMGSTTKTVQANFRALYTTTVETKGPGKGVVKSQNSSIDCGNVCSTNQVDGTEITLEATPERRAIFTGWEGQCSSGGGNSKTCTVKFNSDKKFVATFDHYMLPLTVAKTGPGTVASSPDKQINCGTACNTKYILDTIVTLKETHDSFSRFKGWGGKCSGLAETCTVTIEEGTNAVSARFVALYPLTVVNKYGGVAKTSSGIACGDQGSKLNTAKTCSNIFEQGTSVEVWLDPAGSGVQWSGCDSRILNNCIAQMNGNKEIIISMSPAEEARLVKQALSEVFGGNPAAKSYVENENNQPFKKTLQDLQALRMGHNLAEIKAWINDNYQWYMGQGGIQKVIEDWQKGIAKQVLLEVFASEVSSYPTLAAFLADESQKPFQSALADLKYGREGGGYEGLKNWISQPANRQWYYDATGIGTQIAEIEKQKAELERQKREAEIVAKRPSISSISPAGGEFGKIGNPTVIAGKFYNVQLVTLNGNPVAFSPDSGGQSITLPHVKWGVNPEGVNINTPGNVKVITEYGEATASLISPAQKVLYNANGAKENCFPGVGKGCEGAGGDFQKVLASIGTQIGCENPGSDGSRVCWISTGSIRHDNCCVRHPSGRQCGGPGKDGKPAEDNNHDGNCDTEWMEAVWDTFWRKAWRTTFYADQVYDLTPSGKSLNNRYSEGEAITSLNYCAPAGHELREPHLDAFCCSGQMGKDWFGNSNKKCL